MKLRKKYIYIQSILYKFLLTTPIFSFHFFFQSLLVHVRVSPTWGKGVGSPHTSQKFAHSPQ